MILWIALQIFRGPTFPFALKGTGHILLYTGYNSLKPCRAMRPLGQEPISCVCSVRQLDVTARKPNSDKLHLCENRDTKNEQFMKNKLSLEV